MALESQLYSLIRTIKFGLLSPDEIRKLSVAEIRTPDTYDEDGMAIMNGLMDGRLGALEPGQRCETCGNTAANCQGHFGHIELAVPVIHVSFVNNIYILLMTTCRNCGRFLLSEKMIEELKEAMEQEKRLFGKVKDEFYQDMIRKARKKRKCPHCGTEQFETKFNKPTEFWEVTRTGSKRLTPNMIRERLERIPDSDLRLMGFDPEAMRPEWTILTVLPVPPLCVRPSITLESGLRSEDDLTHKLVDILRINQRLRESIDMGAPTLIIEDLSELLQYHVTTYFDNETSGIPPARHRSGRMLKTIAQRLKGKEGRFRGNLSGKRVDFSARAVISPDPNLDIDEVGIPFDVAKRLTAPEKVTTWNIERMRELVRNGPDKYPGALYVIRPDGRRIRLEYVADRDALADALEPGYIIERQVIDGDIAIFNRQPSLHRMSIMAHRVRVLPYKTFRLHLCVCPPYNADFDGDEMNIHIPQSDEAQAEARLLMRVQDQILSPRYGAPIIGATRDFITAVYLFTKRGTLLTKAEVCQLLMAAGYRGGLPEPVVKEPEPYWTGKQIFSLFLPKDFNYVGKATLCRNCVRCKREKCPIDAYTVVVNGELRSGVIDKNSIGAERAEGIYHRLVKDYGTDFGRNFLNSICRLLDVFITTRGFSFSLHELDLTTDVERKIKRVMTRHKRRIQDLVEKYRSGQLEKLPGKGLEESLEIYLMNELAKARDTAGRIAEKSLDMDNSAAIMIRTGARGTMMNITQMTACIGQQSIRGGRILRGYSGRSLSHFKTRDPSPEARGFIALGYRRGLNPIEFFFHAVGGREGLVDTAVRTQQSGYMQRRLINALEHLHVGYDGTVRTSDGTVVQFVYGEDGVDPAKSDHGKAVNVQHIIRMVKVADKGKPTSRQFVESCLEKIKDELTPKLYNELRRNLLKAGLSELGVKKVVETTVENYKKALIEPGEAVGIVAAQSIGEPGTQMTLRTFHFAGVRERNVTLGLP
ncbi:TPA: DNA-directed RNA polymerase subunit A', partial [Candidatus Bathyarchaeota archaeon]|nr:DNA-directed RNA polymerase subunit A' [Candidatus Bathyarchaeota archaeon]